MLLARGIRAAVTGRARFVSGLARATAENTALLKILIESGDLRTVIDRRYDLDDITEAHAHTETGHKRGHVVVRIAVHPESGVEHESA